MLAITVTLSAPFSLSRWHLPGATRTFSLASGFVSIGVGLLMGWRIAMSPLW